MKSTNNQSQWVKILLALLLLVLLGFLYSKLPPGFPELLKNGVLLTLFAALVLYLAKAFPDSAGKLILNASNPPKYMLIAGLSKDTRKDQGTDVKFQDFHIGRGKTRENSNAVYYMWADNFQKSQINASIIGNEIPYLQILFKNSFESWPCNIAIIPFDFQALENNPFKRYLVFEAQVLDLSQEIDSYIDYLCKSEGVSGLDELKISKLDKIGVSVRVVDGNLQHWYYSLSTRRRRQFEITEKKRWKKCYVNLTNLTKETKNNWKLFGSDGNHLSRSKRPDFSIISLVVLEFGRYSDVGTLQGGIGAIGIRNIRLTDEQPNPKEDLFLN